MSRKLFLMMLVFSMILSNISVYASESYFSGEGTVENPYLISSAEDLVKLSELTNVVATAEAYADKIYKLTADIDMTGINYKPVSYATEMYKPQGKIFSGTLDGDGHIIKNVKFASISTYGATYGIIGYLGGNGVVKNLGVENITVEGGTASRLCIGGIVGSLGSPMTIENCYVRGMNVTTTSADATYAGGIAGRTIGNEGIIKNCYATSLDFTNVKYANLKAGILGSSANVNYKAENCYSTYSRLQGYTSATNSYMETDNCYGMVSVENLTADMLGSAFKKNPTVKNDGLPVLEWESTDGYELKEEEKEVEDPYFKGKGTEEEPFEIDSAEKLCQLSTLSNDANNAKYASKFYILTADIDLSGMKFTPISYATNMYTPKAAAFTGTFDGNGHIIKNITFASISTYGATYGIIGFISANGVVKNLGVENMTVEGGAANRLCIGGIVGSLGSPMTIENCYVRGMSVTTTSTDATYVGGIAGRTIGNEGIIKNCYSTGLDFSKVTRTDLKAGILGSSANVNYKAENCYTTDAKLQGNTSSTNSYMGSTNCYGGESVELLTADVLGDAFDEDSDMLNNGMPVLAWEYDIAHPETVYYTIKSGDVEITDGETDISVNNPIVITFDKEMNTDTFSKIQISKKGAVFNDYIFEVESKTLIIKMDAEYNTEYTIFIPKTVQSLKDESGKSAKADEKTITWRTEAMPKAITVENIKINGEKNPTENIVAGETLKVEVDVKNTGELNSQPVALIVTLFGQDGIMKYAALDTANIKDTNEILSVEFVIPENVGENPTISIMVWDSIITMNAMR